MAVATLQAIKDKVRRLTRSPSLAQLSNDDIEQYINTFVLYDFPENLRIFTLKTTLTFYTEANEDVYGTSDDVDSPLLDFKNRYISVQPPAYVAGYSAWYQQSRSTFFAAYPFTNSIADTNLRGTGAPVAFVGQLSATPVLKRNVLFGTNDVNGNGLQLHDDGNGVLVGNGNGDINYTTGVYHLNFDTDPADGAVITSETVVYSPGRPQSILFFDNQFTVRPVPDKVYPINIEVFRRPTELIVDGVAPELEQWWQYIAYGAAIKVFNDRMDAESVQMIMPEYKNQERLVLRRTIMESNNEQVATIYTGMLNGNLIGGQGPWFY